LSKSKTTQPRGQTVKNQHRAKSNLTDDHSHSNLEEKISPPPISPDQRRPDECGYREGTFSCQRTFSLFSNSHSLRHHPLDFEGFSLGKIILRPRSIAVNNAFK